MYIKVISFQEYADVAHKDVKVFCNKNQFPLFPFCGPQIKLHGEIGLSNHYHVLFDTKIVHSTCAILRIPCACAEFTYIIENPGFVV